LETPIPQLSAEFIDIPIPLAHKLSTVLFTPSMPLSYLIDNLKTLAQFRFIGTLGTQVQSETPQLNSLGTLELPVDIPTATRTLPIFISKLIDVLLFRKHLSARFPKANSRLRYYYS
jgi:hypothetical protein